MLVWVMGRTMGAIGEGTDIIIVIPMDPKKTNWQVTL